jgi:hypothetical protein
MQIKPQIQSLAILTKATNYYDDSQAALFRYCDAPQNTKGFLCVIKFGSDFERYRYEGSWNKEEVVTWMKSWLHNKLNEYLRVEILYSEIAGPSGKIMV